MGRKKLYKTKKEKDEAHKKAMKKYYEENKDLLVAKMKFRILKKKAKGKK